MKNNEDIGNRERKKRNLCFNFKPRNLILKFSYIYSIQNSCDH